MSAALASPVSHTESLTEQSAQLPFEPAGSSLEELILGAWEDLALQQRADCPVCGSELRAAGCTSCGSQLS